MMQEKKIVREVNEVNVLEEKLSSPNDGLVAVDRDIKCKSSKPTKIELVAELSDDGVEDDISTLFTVFHGRKNTMNGKSFILCASRRFSLFSSLCSGAQQNSRLLLDCYIIYYLLSCNMRIIIIT